MEAYSRRENIKFMNVKEETTVDGKEDTEEVLRSFLERDLGYADARSAEIQRVHRNGKGKDGKPRPILARFLGIKTFKQFSRWGKDSRTRNFKFSAITRPKSLSEEDHRWKPLKLLERRGSLHSSAIRSQISYILGENSGRKAKHSLFLKHKYYSLYSIRL